MRRPDSGITQKNDSFGALPEVDYDSLEFYECLSAGTFGTVYRAKWKLTGQIVAVKRLLVLEKEAHILSLLRHRNIIQFFGAVTKPPDFCIVTEFASKGSLYGYLHDKQNPDLAFDAIIQWAFDIASGVHYLHFEAPVVVVHRDLKSKNVVISSNNVCKLCDFGTSKPLIQTTKMTYAGTMPWMSPEMIQSLPVSEATDTWSYGVILWELITREVPFERLNEFRIAWMVVEDQVRLAIPTSCPELFADLLRHCWETDPKSRPNFKEILTVLTEIRSDDITSTQTRDFLRRKDEWKLEIQIETDRLKEKESELNDKQMKLREWEQRLRSREQNLEYNRRRELPSHDVNVWAEEDVVTWLLKQNFNNVVYQQLTDLATIFRKQQITGERLLLLTETDLANLGVTSPIFRWQLLREITRLNYDNRRLINFPPLSQPNDVPQSTARTQAREPRRSASTVSSGQQRSVDLTLLFGIYVRPSLGIDSHKWKVLMDIEDDSDFLANHPTISEFEQLIVDVRFMVSAPPYMYKVTKFPYVMREWLIGLNGVIRVQCVVNFTDNVRQPRNTTFSFDVDYERRGLLLEKRVQLYLRALLTTPRSAAGGAASGAGSVSSIISGAGALRDYLTPSASSSNLFAMGSRSSAALAPAWQDRSFSDAVPVVSPPPLPTPKKSPLWSQIVAGLGQHPSAAATGDSTLVKKQASAPGPVAVNSSTQQLQLNARAVSHDPNLARLRSTEAGSPRSVSGNDTISSTVPRPVSQSVSFTVGESNKDSATAVIERADSTTSTPLSVPKRRGGRIRYPRNHSRGQSTSDSYSNTSEASSASSTLLSRQRTPMARILDGFERVENEKEKDDPRSARAKQQGPESSSAMSVQVHGGYQKWKWKH